MREAACSSYTGHSGPCKDGFPQTAVCAGICTDALVPRCCDEEWCGRFYNQFGGKPPEHLIAPPNPLGDL